MCQWSSVMQFIILLIFIVFCCCLGEEECFMFHFFSLLFFLPFSSCYWFFPLTLGKGLSFTHYLCSCCFWLFFLPLFGSGRILAAAAVVVAVVVSFSADDCCWRPDKMNIHYNGEIFPLVAYLGQHLAQQKSFFATKLWIQVRFFEIRVCSLIYLLTRRRTRPYYFNWNKVSVFQLLFIIFLFTPLPSSTCTTLTLFAINYSKKKRCQFHSFCFIKTLTVSQYKLFFVFGLFCLFIFQIFFTFSLHADTFSIERQQALCLAHTNLNFTPFSVRICLSWMCVQLWSIACVRLEKKFLRSQHSTFLTVCFLFASMESASFKSTFKLLKKQF